MAAGQVPRHSSVSSKGKTGPVLCEVLGQPSPDGREKECARRLQAWPINS